MLMYVLLQAFKLFINLVMRWGPLHLNQVGQLGIGEIDGWLEEEGENDPCWMKISNQAIYIGGKIS